VGIIIGIAVLCLLIVFWPLKEDNQHTPISAASKANRQRKVQSRRRPEMLEPIPKLSAGGTQQFFGIVEWVDR
jgi:hypothetical protein